MSVEFSNAYQEILLDNLMSIIKQKAKLKLNPTKIISFVNKVTPDNKNPIFIY
jgi:hypothetical protein